MSLYYILDWIYYLFFLTILIPLGIALYRLPSVPSVTRWVIWLLLSLLVIEIASIILRFNIVRNHFLYYFQTLAILICGAGFYAPDFGYKNCYVISLVVACLIPLEVWMWVGFNHINSTTLTLSRVLLALGSFIKIRQLFIKEPAQALSEQSSFFINLGLLIIGFFSLVTNAFKSQFIESSLNLYYFFDTMAVITNAFGFVILARGFWLIPVTRPKSLIR